MILTPNDFVNEFSVSVAFNDSETRIESIIERWERYYLAMLLGGIEPPAEIEDPLTFEYCDKIYVSEGLKTMLLCLICVQIKYNSNDIPTSVGNFEPKQEAGSNVNYSGAISLYNRGIDTYRAIQYWCLKENVEGFKGQMLKYLSWC